MKAINFINWKYIGLTGCLVASLLTACGDDETGPEVVTPLEPKLEIVNEASTFSFSSAGNSAQVLTFNANQDWHIVLDDSEGVDNSWVVLFEREGTAGEGNKVWVAAAENVEPDARRANFSLVSGGFKFDFVIYQAQKDAVVITDPKAYENLDAGEHIISVEFGINTGGIKPVSSIPVTRAGSCRQTNAPQVNRRHVRWKTIHCTLRCCRIRSLIFVEVPLKSLRKIMIM